jgi:hypothetical protein
MRIPDGRFDLVVIHPGPAGGRPDQKEHEGGRRQRRGRSHRFHQDDLLIFGRGDAHSCSAGRGVFTGF